MIDVTVEQIAPEVGSGTFHGWNTARLIKTGGALYFAANKPMPADADGSDWTVQNTLMYRRDLSAGGAWELAVDIAPRTYTCCLDHLGRFWSISPKHFNYITLWRSEPNLGLGELTRCYDGSCAYLGMGVDRHTGNHLLVHAEDTNHMPRFANALITIYYDTATDSWRKGRIETPQGRFGYVGIVVRGRKAVLVTQSTQLDPTVEPNKPHYNWRMLQLARCDDLMESRWTVRPWLMRRFGQTMPQDMMEAPDGRIVVAYKHRGGDESYEATQRDPYALYLGRFGNDLSVETFTSGLDATSTRLFVGSDRRWYMTGRREGQKILRLWRLDEAAGFAPTAEWELPGTEPMEGGHLHTLRPHLVGGEGDGDTVHLVASDVPGIAFGDFRDRFGLLHARFKLPVDD